MITIECDDMPDLKVELAAYLAENIAAVTAIKSSSIVLDPLTEEVPDPNDVSMYVKAFLDKKDLSKDFIVKVAGEKIMIISISERKVKVKNTDSGLLVCPHCGKVTPYEEEMNVHVRAHYLV